MATTYRADAEAQPPAVSAEEPQRPKRVSVAFIEDALASLLDGAKRSGLSNGDFPVEAVRTLNRLLSWEERGYRVIARAPDGREFPLSPVLKGVRPPGS